VFGWLKNSKQRPKELLPIDASLFESGGARLYNALRAHWASLDENYTPHLAYAEVSALEDRYSIRLPEDFRSYLLNAAPTSTFMDEIGTSGGRLTRLNHIPTNVPTGRRVVLTPK
jgi:hypothetical protein